MTDNVIDNYFMLCEDCAGYNDYGIIDVERYCKADIAIVETKVKTGIKRFQDAGYIIATGNVEEDIELSTNPCECCRSTLPGYRCHSLLVSVSATNHTTTLRH